MKNFKKVLFFALFMGALLTCVTSCNKEEDSTVISPIELIAGDYDYFQLTPEQAALIASGSNLRIVGGMQSMSGGGSSELIIVCYGGPSTSQNSTCFGIWGASECGDLSIECNPGGQSETDNNDSLCWCYD